MSHTQKVALIGRPNVGKSTLFNRLVGRRVALVHDEPGVTRDRREGLSHLYGLTFMAIDTAGLADPRASALTAGMVQQTECAIVEADVVLFLIDGREGLTPFDQDLAKLLRRYNKPIIVVVNKCEGRSIQPGLQEAYRLGFQEVLPLSAEHGEGLVELADALTPYITKEPEIDISSEKPLQLAIVGRPNAGKSTLINRLVGEERLLTGDMPGVTRDAIGLDWSYHGRAIHIVDTAGLRRRSKVDAPVEHLAVQDTHRVIRYAEIVVLVIDALMPFEKQDLTIAQGVIEEGRALIIAVNKIDLIQNPTTFLKKLTTTLDNQLAQVRDVPCLGISAKTGKNCTGLLNAVLSMERLWNRRLSTGQLNRWLIPVTEAHTPPMIKGRRIRLKYMTQIKTRPPTFTLFASQAGELPESYQRYLINRLRADFDMPGVPIRLYMRQAKNPYAE